METDIQLNEVFIAVTLKDIKNIHLSVHPPNGRVTIAAPIETDLDRLRVFALSKLKWIRDQQKKIRGQEREPKREYLNRESHYVWGERYLLELVEHDAPPEVELGHSQLILRTRKGATKEQKATLLDAWYRDQLRQAYPALIAKWEPQMNVKVARVFIRRMKTRWGSCNHRKKSIRLNTDLARKPRECLEYIVVHEMCHLLEPTHNANFVALMDHFLPRWRFLRDTLNSLPVRHDHWVY